MLENGLPLINKIATEKPVRTWPNDATPWVRITCIKRRLEANVATDKIFRRRLEKDSPSSSSAPSCLLQLTQRETESQEWGGILAAYWQQTACHAERRNSGTFCNCDSAIVALGRRQSSLLQNQYDAKGPLGQDPGRWRWSACNQWFLPLVSRWSFTSVPQSTTLVFFLSFLSCCPLPFNHGMWLRGL